MFGPGQVAWEGATGAIAAFARRALEGRPIVIPGDPRRVRDFVYVDDVVAALETIAARGRWGETLTLAGGRPMTLLRAAELVRDAVVRACRSRRRAASCRPARTRLPLGRGPGRARVDGPSDRGRRRELCRMAPPPPPPMPLPPSRC